MRAAYRDLRQTAEQLAAAGAELVAAWDALRVANAEFEAGEGTPLEVVTALQNLARTEAAVVRAMVGYNLALARIDRALGTILERISQPPPWNSAAARDNMPRDR